MKEKQFQINGTPLKQKIIWSSFKWHDPHDDQVYMARSYRLTENSLRLQSVIAMIDLSAIFTWFLETNGEIFIQFQFSSEEFDCLLKASAKQTLQLFLHKYVWSGSCIKARVGFYGFYSKEIAGSSHSEDQKKICL